jgi:hypothetical protein
MMRVRTSILPPPLDEQTVQQLTDLADDIVTAMNEGRTCSDLIAAFNNATGQQFDRAAFHGAWEGSGTRTLVESALRPSPQRVEGLTDEELLEIIISLVNGEGSPSEEGYWLEFLDRNLPHPAIVDLIYWRELTPEQILAEAKAYKPIAL